MKRKAGMILHANPIPKTELEARLLDFGYWAEKTGHQYRVWVRDENSSGWEYECQVADLKSLQHFADHMQDAQKKFRALQKSATIADDMGFSLPWSVLASAQNNADDTYPREHPKYWDIALDSIASVSAFNENAIVRRWFEKRGYAW